MNDDIKYDNLICEYIWIDNWSELHSKTVVIKYDNYTIEKLPTEIYNGNKTMDIYPYDKEGILNPVSMCYDPFRGYPHLLVLCTQYTNEWDAVSFSSRHYANNLIDSIYNNYYLRPLITVEQEFYLTTIDNILLSESLTKNKINQGFEREIMETFLNSCIYAGLKINGYNKELGLSQWKYKMGQLSPLEMADQLYFSKYILQRITQTFNIFVNYHPRPFLQYPGSGMYVNFSTYQMRTAPHGYEYIKDALYNLEQHHNTNIEHFGMYNNVRLDGTHNTSLYNSFTSSINLTGSVKIDQDAIECDCGYIQDRRPGANADPYVTFALIYYSSQTPLNNINNQDDTHNTDDINDLNYINHEDVPSTPDLSSSLSDSSISP